MVIAICFFAERKRSALRHAFAMQLKVYLYSLLRLCWRYCGYCGNDGKCIARRYRLLPRQVGKPIDYEPLIKTLTMYFGAPRAEDLKNVEREKES